MRFRYFVNGFGCPSSLAMNAYFLLPLISREEGRSSSQERLFSIRSSRTFFQRLELRPFRYGQLLRLTAAALPISCHPVPQSLLNQHKLTRHTSTIGQDLSVNSKTVATRIPAYFTRNLLTTSPLLSRDATWRFQFREGPGGLVSAAGGLINECMAGLSQEIF